MAFNGPFEKPENSEGGLGIQDDFHTAVNNVLEQFNGPLQYYRIPIEQGEPLAGNDAQYSFFKWMYELTKNMPYAYQLRVRSVVFNAVSSVEAEVHDKNVASTVTPQTRQ